MPPEWLGRGGGPPRRGSSPVLRSRTASARSRGSGAVARRPVDRAPAQAT